MLLGTFIILVNHVVIGRCRTALLGQFEQRNQIHLITGASTPGRENGGANSALTERGLAATGLTPGYLTGSHSHSLIIIGQRRHHEIRGVCPLKTML